ncbi:hypothetical protein I6F65_20320 [Pseudoalteromonas sp. SWXJZ94C]|uniref:hypothetical protein n=1 Tax=Pseudoalteromonas sp. SWXJZ94C TaxID=2792065 RepID=UPI0018CE6DCC|nr:hypothetical protein [Pseudoalteromonas sp. SWXJZ94C]MBH0059291.1 hypothetical protein [Pseudoalteromonas sp. SWXJZ94C]
MGYDVTFHAISKNELKKYVYDVLEDPTLAEERGKELTDDESEQEFIQSIYGNMREWLSASQQEQNDFAKTFSFAIAAISGYLHDFYYSRNFALSFIEFEDHPGFFKSYTSIEGSPLVGCTDLSGGNIEGNYSASGFSDDAKGIFELMEQIDLDVDEEGLDSLKRALKYCVDNDLLFLEASDLVVPFSNESFTNTDKMKAHFLKNIEG